MDVVSFLLGKFLRLGLLGHMGGIVLTIEKSTQSLPKWLYHLILPPAMDESSRCSTDLLTFGKIK